ncbi:MAG: ABC transporter permease [Bacteriovoracaceae bacterium]|nr:ABC transporter permease [Bacteriovoracaceae bacterium]
MENFNLAFLNALHLLVSLDSEILQYAWRSVYIALISTTLVIVVTLPMGILIAENNFRFKRAIIIVLNTLMSLPTVLIGLVVYSFIGRMGIFGSFKLLFTIPGIIIGEVILIFPLVLSLVIAALSRDNTQITKTAKALGASQLQTFLILIKESRYAILSSIIAAFGRVIGEVGIATIIGGNAEKYTRTLTTSIVLNINMGYFDYALAIGIVLLTLSLIVNLFMQLLQGSKR